MHGLLAESLVCLSAFTLSFSWFHMSDSFWETPVYTGGRMEVERQITTKYYYEKSFDLANSHRGTLGSSGFLWTTCAQSVRKLWLWGFC